MTIPYEHLVGLRFGRLTVLRQVESGDCRRRWLCRCSCTAQTTVPTDRLTSGNTRSCGCLNREKSAERRRLFNQARATHGLTKSPTWSSWRGMVARCTVPATHGYAYYGGRGVSVDSSWVGPGGFARFLADVGERPPGASLGRLGDEGDYVPGNVRWQSREQQLETRRQKRNRLKEATCTNRMAKRPPSGADRRAAGKRR